MIRFRDLVSFVLRCKGMAFLQFEQEKSRKSVVWVHLRAEFGDFCQLWKTFKQVFGPAKLEILYEKNKSWRAFFARKA